MSTDLYKFLEELLGLFNKCHSGGYDVSSIKLTTTVVNFRGIEKTELCKYGIFDTYDHIKLPTAHITKDNIKQLSTIIRSTTELENYLKEQKLKQQKIVYSDKKFISQDKINDIYKLSFGNNIYYIQQDGVEKLYIGIDVICQANENTKLLNKAPMDYYLRYLARTNMDIRNFNLPTVDILCYYAKENKEYLNIPHNISCNTISVSNHFCTPMKLDKYLYSKYVKIHPCYLFEHKYVTLSYNNVIIDYSKYINDHADLLQVDHKYSHYITDNHMRITYGKTNCNAKINEDDEIDEIIYYPLTENVVKTLNGYITSVSYKPISMTNIMNEVEEVKQLVSIFSLPLDVKFRY